MTTEFKLPTLGENVQTGQVVTILVSEGDTIKVDDPVLEIETDKATIEVPSSVEGKITEIHVKAGDTVKVGQVILITEDGAVETAAPKPQPAETPTIEKAPETPPVQPKPAPVSEPSKAQATAPAAPRLIEFRLPNLGENIRSGDVVGVLVAVGDTITEGQGVLEIETDKATAEVPSDVSGVVKEIHIKQGDTVQSDQLLLTVEAQNGAPTKTEPETKTAPVTAAVTIDQAPAAPKEKAKEEAPAAAVRVAVPVEGVSSRPEHSLIPAAPNVRRMAREIGLDITQVAGTGSEGRVSMDDVKRHARETISRLSADGALVSRLASAPLPDFSQWGEIERQPMSNIRRATAEHLSMAWATIPHVTQFDKADIGELEKLRKQFAERVEKAGGKLTITAILLKVVAAALKQFPQFNASVDMVNHEIIYKKYYHIGVAVDTERGLLVPVIRDVDRKNIQELAIELGEVAEKARTRKLRPEDMEGGVFSITNLGGIGGTNFTPIVNAPEVAILGVARGSTEPIFKAGQFEPRLMLPLALSYDHRLIDGADAVRFLRWLVRALEEPFMLALQGW
jgi:pyruvate dehydrogenase E2 component (dihydrolipoamide acetyltransferase)